LAWSTTHSPLALLLLAQASFQSLTSLTGTQGRGTSFTLVRYTTVVKKLFNFSENLKKCMK
ncbi:hypothetical protein EHQ94_00110, partial [Leptospira meyeri]